MKLSKNTQNSETNQSQQPFPTLPTQIHTVQTLQRETEEPCIKRKSKNPQITKSYRQN